LVLNKAFLTFQLPTFDPNYEDQRPEIKYSAIFPVYGFRVDFLNVGRIVALQ